MSSRQINLNTLYQIAGKSLAVIFGFVSVIFLRRTLGLSGFGNYIYIISYISIFVTFSDFGTHLVSVKQASQKQKIESKILGNALMLRTVFSLIASFFALLIGFLAFRQNITLCLLSLPLIILTTFKSSLLIVFHTKLKLYYSSLHEILIAFFLFLVSWHLYLSGGTLSLYLISANVIYFFLSFPFLYFALKTVPLNFTPNARIQKKIITQSLPLAGILVLYTLYSKIDNVLLEFIDGSESVGVYGVSYKIYENLVLPSAYLMNSVLPIMAKKLKNARSFSNLFQKTADVLIFSSLILMTLIIIFAPFLTALIVGSKSPLETSVLRILAIALPFAFLNHLAGYAIITINQQSKFLLISFFALVFNLTVNMLFIPRFSFTAAAVNTVLTQFLVLVLSFWVIYKQKGISPNLLNWPKTFYLFVKKKGRVFDE